MAPTPDPPSGASTPRFVSQAATAEDLLKTQTVGLVNLAEFRKRRADALDQKEREAQDSARSGASTPGLESGDGALTPNPDAPPAKKKKKPARKILSYDDGDDGENPQPLSKPTKSKTIHSKADADMEVGLRKVKPNPNSLLPAPRAQTKAAQAAETQERERLRKEFLEVQEKVKNAEFAIPFVFYDGANIPGDVVKVKKGDHIWLFLERARKVGAEKGVQGSGAAAGGMSSHDSKKQWARVGVDDLMCVRGGVIIPHHYEFYYFIANKTPDPTREGKLLFDYKGTADAANVEDVPLLRVPGQEKLEGRDEDPVYTKVVDRRWYQKNKHIFPASTWKEFKMGKEFEDTAKQRKDAEGNAFFFA